MIKQLIILILSVVALQGCSVYGDLTKCEGFDEAGTRCTGLISNLDYSKGRESGVIPANTVDAAKPTPDGISCADSGCMVQLDYDLLDSQVKNDEFARLILDKKIGMAETDPILRPAKTVRATIYPYSDGSKFYQLRHIWIKTYEEEWIVGSTMLVDAKGTVMMDKGATINMGGLNETAQARTNASGEYGAENVENADRESNTYTGKGGYSDNNASCGEESSNDTRKKSASGDNKTINIKPPAELNQESAKGIGAYRSGDIVTINVTYLNIRQQASAKSRVIGVIPAGGKLQILDETIDKWRRVRVVYYPKNQLTKEYDGWVNSEYLMAISPKLETWEDAL